MGHPVVSIAAIGNTLFWLQAGEQAGVVCVCDGAAELPLVPGAAADEPAGGGAQGGRQVGRRQPDAALPEPARAGQTAGRMHDGLIE